MKLVVLISGNGSNLQAIIDAIASHQLDAKISAVISNRAEAYGLERARSAHIPTLVLNPKEYADKLAYDDALKNSIASFQPDLIILAGFMRILTPGFVHHFAGKILNIHPALLPHYKGLNTHERVLAAKAKQHGTTVHLVTEELDGGPIIAQAKLNILPNDTVDTLRQRVLKLEHTLYPTVIQWFATGRLKFNKLKPELDGQPLSLEGKQIEE